MGKITRKRNELPRALQSIDVKAVLRRRGVYLRQNENRRLKREARSIAESIIKNRKLKTQRKDELPIPEPQKYSSLTNDQAQAYWEKQIHSVSIIEDHFEKAVIKVLYIVQNKALSNLETIVDRNKAVKRGRPKTKDIFDDTEEADLQTEATLNLEPLLQNMAVVAGQDAIKLTGSKDPYILSNKLRAQIQANVEKFTQSMLDTDQKELTSIILDGIKNGDSVSQIRDSITTTFGDYSKMQAQRITRTEVLRASVQASKDAFAQSGVVEGVQWLTAGAEDECADYEGQIESLDGNFYSDTTEFADGDPPLHPNCRCILIPVIIGGDTSINADE